MRTKSTLGFCMLFFSVISIGQAGEIKSEKRILYAGRLSKVGGAWYFSSVKLAKNPFRIHLSPSNTEHLSEKSQGKLALVSFKSDKGMEMDRKSKYFTILTKAPTEAQLERGVFAEP